MHLLVGFLLITSLYFILCIFLFKAQPLSVAPASAADGYFWPFRPYYRISSGRSETPRSPSLDGLGYEERDEERVFVKTPLGEGKCEGVRAIAVRTSASADRHLLYPAVSGSAAVSLALTPRSHPDILSRSVWARTDSADTSLWREREETRAGLLRIPRAIYRPGRQIKGSELILTLGRNQSWTETISFFRVSLDLKADLVGELEAFLRVELRIPAVVMTNCSGLR